MSATKVSLARPPNPYCVAKRCEVSGEPCWGVRWSSRFFVAQCSVAAPAHQVPDYKLRFPVEEVCLRTPGRSAQKEPGGWRGGGDESCPAGLMRLWGVGWLGVGGGSVLLGEGGGLGSEDANRWVHVLVALIGDVRAVVPGEVNTRVAAAITCDRTPRFPRAVCLHRLVRAADRHPCSSLRALRCMDSRTLRPPSLCVWRLRVEGRQEETAMHAASTLRRAFAGWFSFSHRCVWTCISTHQICVASCCM